MRHFRTGGRPHPRSARRARSASPAASSPSWRTASASRASRCSARSPTRLGIQLSELLDDAAPTERAGLEIELDRAQRSRCTPQLGLPVVRAGKGMPDETLACARRPAPRARPPGARGDRDPRGGPARQHRAARADARRATTTCPRSRTLAEDAAARASATSRGALTHRAVSLMAEQLGFELVHVARPAALGPLGHRPRERAHLPAAGLDPRRARPAVDGAAGDRAPPARARGARRATPTSCSSGSRSTTSPPPCLMPRTQAVAVPAAGQGRPQHRGRGLPRRVRRRPTRRRRCGSPTSRRRTST